MPLPCYRSFGTWRPQQNADPSRLGCSGYGMVVGSAQRANIQYCKVLCRYCAQPGKPRGKRKVERNSMSGDFFPIHSPQVPPFHLVAPETLEAVPEAYKQLVYRYTGIASRHYRQARQITVGFIAPTTTSTTQLTTRHKTGSKQSNTRKPLHTLPLLKKKHLQINITASFLILSLSESKTRES